MNLYTESEVSQSPLENARIAVLGYGSQGRAQALNLRDSGLDVRVGLRPGGPSTSLAEEDGFEPVSFAEAVRGASVVVMLVPDTVQAELYEREVEPHLSPGSMLLFSHGFNVHYETIRPRPDLDVAMVAPKAPGALVRRQFEAGRGVPCLFAVQQDASGRARERTLAYAVAIGGARAGVLETSFAEETETDLFGEQAVLCGGATELVVAGFETLVSAGYQPEVAYFECLHELKLIVDLLYEGGLAKMHEFVSDTAKYGDLSRGHRVIDESARARMREILDEVRSGAFAREWLDEDAAGRPSYNDLLKRDLAHPIERVGRALRARMSWIAREGRAELEAAT